MQLTKEELIRIQNILDEWCHYDSRADAEDKKLIKKIYIMAHGKDNSGY